MIEVLESILEEARTSGAESAEVYHVQTEETPVRFEANRLKELNSRQTAGVALRVIKDGRIGFASSTRPGDVTDVVSAAIETAPFGPEAKFAFPGGTEAANVETFDPSTEGLSIDDMIQVGQQLVDSARAAEPDLQCDASVRRATGTLTLVNSNGGQFTHRASSLIAWINGTLIRGTDMLFVGSADASCRPEINRATIESDVRLQLERSKRNAETRTAQMPVIFTALGVAEALLPPLLMAFSGRLVVQGQSPLVGMLGEEKYDPRISVHDDGTLPMRVSSRPFDDEGVASRRIPLIEKGVVRSFMYDLQTAGLAGESSTGSAQRALTSQPTIGSTSLIIEPGDTTFDDMVRGIEEGVIVEELMGAGQGNVMGGDFSGNVLLGYKIEKGEIVGRVKNTIVAGNVHQALSKVTAIGSEARWISGSVHTPPLLIDGLAVSASGS
jgi:PmbA protein